MTLENINIDELNLDKTLLCGQAFRWAKDKDVWCGVVNGEIIILKQVPNNQGSTTIYTNVKNEDILKLIEYLNLDMNYTDEINKINLNDFEKTVYNSGKGIHILRQDLFETIVTFLMSSCNTMNNIRNIVENLSKAFGTELETEFNGKIYKRYSFPTPNQLSNVTIEQIRQCKAGMRAEYLYSFVQTLNKNPEILNELSKMTYTDAYKTLLKFKGIGAKVANCICLFGLHHIDAFPIDTHIQNIIDNKYNGYSPKNKFGNVAGIMQQYMFYYEAFSK